MVFHLFFPFFRGRTPVSFMTPRWYSWVKMRKNGHPWGKQTSGAKGLGLGFGGNWWFFGNFFFRFLRGKKSAFFMTPRRNSWVKTRKKCYSWGKQTSGANLSLVSVHQPNLHWEFSMWSTSSGFTLIIFNFTLLLIWIWLFRGVGVQVWVYDLKYFSSKKCWWSFQFSFPQK